MSDRAPRLSAVVLAAGRSKRFGGVRPKVLHPLCGRPILMHVLEVLREVHTKKRLNKVCVVVPPGKEVERAVSGLKWPFETVFAVQKEPRGTGDAAGIGVRKVGEVDEVLVLAGDVPLVRPESLLSLVRARREAEAAASMLTAILDDGGPYGRILRTDTWITGVVEARDATPEQLEIREINTCTYAFDRAALKRALPRIGVDNAQGERYLTDVVGELISEGEHVTSVQGHPTEVLGTNTRAEYATVARIARGRIVEGLMDSGVTVIDPDSTYVDAGVKVGADTVLLPNTFLEGDTVVGCGCEIGPNTRLRDTTVGDQASVAFSIASAAKIGAECSVGPFSNLREGTVLDRGAKAGSYSEMKNARIGAGSKVPHFSYMGDVSVGAGSNIGAGTITCNYDGKAKHPTRIGDEVFIGSDSILVAPLRVGRGAYTGAGSVVTRDVPAGGLVYGVPATVRRKAERTGGGAKKGRTGKRKGKATKRKATKRKGRA